MSTIRILEGFANQHLFRLSYPIRKRWGNHPLLQSMMPVDIGWFPQAQYHYCERPQGALEHILIFCVAGEGWFEIDGIRQPIYANEALFIRQNVSHIYGSSEHFPWSIHWTHFVGNEGNFFMSQVPEDEHKVLVESQCRVRVEELFQQCYDLLMEGFLEKRLIHAAQILGHLLSELFYNNPAFLPAQRTNQFRDIEPTLNYLRQNTDKPLTLADMAAYADISIPHFSRVFKSQTGYSPMDYFIHLKVQKASSMLLLTRMTIREIALMVGYDDPYYFSRIFKKVVGAPPTAIRQEAQWQSDT
jgi:AraC-like DNA-binding protein